MPLQAEFVRSETILDRIASSKIRLDQLTAQVRPSGHTIRASHNARIYEMIVLIVSKTLFCHKPGEVTNIRGLASVMPFSATTNKIRQRTGSDFRIHFAGWIDVTLIQAVTLMNKEASLINRANVLSWSYRTARVQRTGRDEYTTSRSISPNCRRTMILTLAVIAGPRSSIRRLMNRKLSSLIYPSHTLTLVSSMK